MKQHRIYNATGSTHPLRILLIGAQGQIGGELLKSLRHLGEIVPAARSMGTSSGAGKSLAVDLSDPDGIRGLVRSVGPGLIINAAAYTAVDKAESEPEMAMAVNGIAPGILAEEAGRLGAALIHYSTDYIYDGSGNTPWREEDPAGPLSVYGKSKLAGDMAVKAAGVPHLIFRTSWVHGVQGHNFVKTMLRLGTERTSLSIVNDQIGAPTSAHVIAEATAHVVAQFLGQITGIHEESGGTLNLACQGETSWYEFALEIFRLAARQGVPLSVKSVEPIPSSHYPAAAQRPKNSRLNCHRLWERFAVQLPTWEVAFRDTFPSVLKSWKAETAAGPKPPHHLALSGKRRETQPT